MDMLRFTYDVDMQFDTDGQIIRKVRWYFVDDNTPSFPAPQKFGSQVWQWRGLEPGGIGERWDSVRQRNDGTVPWPIREPRLCEDVPIEWFDEGCPSDAEPLKLTPLGQAACCAPASGLFIGVKLRARLLPPQKGGVTLRGTIRLSKIYHLLGGVLPGGEISVTPPHKYKGGVLVGATVRPKLTRRSEGGVLLTATVKRKALLRGKGGTYQGATTDLMLIKVLKGGLKSGANLESLIKPHFKGGLKPGGSYYSPPLDCVPWRGTSQSSYTAYNQTTGQYWSIWSYSSTSCSFSSPSDFLQKFTLEQDTSAGCGVYDATKAFVYTNYPPIYTCPATLMAWDPATYMAEFQVSMGCTYYAGHVFQVYLPP